MRLLRKPDRHLWLAGSTHKPQMPVRSETHKQSVMLVTCCPQAERNPKCSLCLSAQNSANFFAGTGNARGKSTCGFGDGVCFLKPQQHKSYAPFAPQTPGLSGQEGRIGRLILLFLKKCVIQSPRLVGIDEHQNMTEASLVVEGMFGVFDSIFTLVVFQIL